eukprot:COSAG06_NODE_28640_length_570_cov_2.619958_2_plen_112_part_01
MTWLHCGCGRFVCTAPITAAARAIGASAACNAATSLAVFSTVFCHPRAPHSAAGSLKRNFLQALPPRRTIRVGNPEILEAQGAAREAAAEAKKNKKKDERSKSKVDRSLPKK